jgi:hypothetical protein
MDPLRVLAAFLLNSSKTCIVQRVQLISKWCVRVLTLPTGHIRTWDRPKEGAADDSGRPVTSPSGS